MCMRGKLLILYNAFMDFCVIEKKSWKYPSHLAGNNENMALKCHNFSPNMLDKQISSKVTDEETTKFNLKVIYQQKVFNFRCDH